MRIFAVLVLYKKKLEESETYISLLNSYFNSKLLQLEFFLLVYDNSPIKQKFIPNTPFKYQYIHDPHNSGLSVAYNAALRIAVLMNFPWLLLLDHDTKIPNDFISMTVKILEKNISNESIVSFVPKVICNGILVSPSRIMLGIHFRPIKIDFTGISNFQITAINSGTLLKVSFLSKIKGFNDLFKLDYLDHWLFNKIYVDGKKVYVYKSIVQHDLSISDIKTNVSQTRYISILQSEKLFYLKYKSRGANFFYLIKLFFRFIRLFFFLHNKKFAFMVLKQLCESTLDVVSLLNKNQFDKFKT